VSRVFGDTSAFYAFLVSSDENHPAAVGAFDRLSARDAALVSSSYVLVETYALLEHRVGLEAIAAFRNDLESLLDIVWVGGELHARALDLLVARRRRGLSLVDATSFVIMRDQAIDEAFTFDGHFSDEGFRQVG
jgi:predicted nucleic acid-binding protein